ncbi:MAG: DMT family transporter [Bacteroidales bacterium]|nr:DMT family transporter [Bacteroidales bacterium]
MTKKEITGYIYAGIASLALANSFIFSKLSFEYVNFYQFGFFWFLTGTLWNFIYLFVIRSRGKFSFRQSAKGITKNLMLVAVLEAVATGLFYYAILIMENPGVVSFIGNIGPVLVVIFGVIFLKESFNGIQFIGIVLALGGVSALSINGFNTVDDLFKPGTQYVFLAAFLFSIATIVARKKRKTIDAGVLSAVRAIILLLAFVLLVIVKNISLDISVKAWILLSLGAFLEVFITIVFAYKSLQYIEAFKTSIIISTKGIFALISAWIFLHLTPLHLEIIGGIISILGVVLVSIQKKK